LTQLADAAFQIPAPAQYLAVHGVFETNEDANQAPITKDEQSILVGTVGHHRNGL
jgi:hypothetical protein